MAIGLGKMLGFEYKENFNYPYIAASITDFGEDGIYPYQYGLEIMCISH